MVTGNFHLPGSCSSHHCTELTYSSVQKTTQNFKQLPELAVPNVNYTGAREVKKSPEHWLLSCSFPSHTEYDGNRAATSSHLHTRNKLVDRKSTELLRAGSCKQIILVLKCPRQYPVPMSFTARLTYNMGIDKKVLL